jgi:small subunit ribosomal protein S1
VTEPEDDFATLFAASVKTSLVKKGQTIEGTIVAIGPEFAFVNIGGKGEASIAVDELKNDDGVLGVAVGDRIQATVVSTHDGVTLSRHLIRGAASDRQIEDAFHARLPVDGKVEKVIKGGYEVRVGRSRAFCPFSQIDLARTADPAEHLGRVYTFRITEFKEGGKNLVISRRALLEDEQRAAAAEVRRSIVPGAVLAGRVVSVRDFGAFVDLGAGVQGLVHISEMGWSRVSDATQVVAPGETITVKVLRVDDDMQKIALGLKQLSDDPWATVPTRYAVGQAYPGRIARLAEFGVFVELEPGVTGLIPASEADVPNDAALAKAFPIGDDVEAIVLEVDAGARRMRLSRRAVRSAQETAELREYSERQGAEDTTGFGSLADKLRGALKPR